MIYWTPKNHVKNENHVILETSCALGRPKTLREGYERIKLQKDTRRLWAERKALLQP